MLSKFLKMFTKERNLELRSSDEVTSLHQAVSEGNVELVKNLLQRGAHVNTHIQYPPFLTSLHIAVQKGNEEIVKLLTNAGADVNAKAEEDITPLCIAIENGYLNIAKLLIQQEATSLDSFDKDGFTPLHLAVQNRRTDMIDLLLKEGANINISEYGGETPLHVAISLQDLKLIKFLVEKGADISCKMLNGDIPLHLAIHDEKIVKFLVNAGADVNAIGSRGLTALHNAVIDGNLSVVKLLVEQGADINAVGNYMPYDGFTPLHLVHFPHNYDQLDSVQISEFLLQKGALVNAKAYNDFTSLHFAAQLRLVQMAKVLLRYGADVNSIETHSGYTPLHTAVEYGCEDFVKLLLKNGRTDLEVVDFNGKTALSLAMDQGHSTIVEIILKSKEEINKLKAEKIGNSNVSFFEILSKSDKQIVNILGNRDIVTILEAGNWKTNFPSYCDVIMEQFEKGKHRKELVDTCLENVKFLPLTLDCFKIVLNFLSNVDIKMLTAAADQIC